MDMDSPRCDWVPAGPHVSKYHLPGIQGPAERNACGIYRVHCWVQCQVPQGTLIRVLTMQKLVLLYRLGAGGAALFPFVTGQVSGKYGILAMPAVCLFMTITMLILWIFVPSKRSPDHDS